MLRAMARSTEERRRALKTSLVLSRLIVIPITDPFELDAPSEAPSCARFARAG